MPCADGLSAPRTGQDLALTGPLSLWEMKPRSVSSLSLPGSLQLVSPSGNVALCSVSWVWFASLSVKPEQVVAGSIEDRERSGKARE